MSNNNNNFGPYWMVNSEEVGLGIIIMIIIFVFPVFPFTMFGVALGKALINNNFAIWGFGIFFFLLGYIILFLVSEKFGFRYAVLLVFLEYYIVDYLNSDGKTMYMQKIVNDFVNWGLSTI